MSNTARSAIPTTGDNGKVHVYSEANDRFDLTDLFPRIRVPARMFNGSGFGAPTLSYTGSTTNSVPAYIFTGAANLGVVAIIGIPPTWATVNIDVLWCPTVGSGTGNVQWRVDQNSLTVGASVSATETTGTAADIAVPTTQYVLTSSRLVTGAAVDPTKPYRIEVIRNGASDTNNDDVAFVEALVTKAS